MNRALIFGIAIFFAVVGIALMGGDNLAVAGHGCHGCHGCDGGCDGGGGCHGGFLGGCHGGGLFNGCHGGRGCHGGGLLRRLFNCHGCNGCHGDNDCCGEVVVEACGCCGSSADAVPVDDGGEVAPEAEAPAPPAPEAGTSIQRPFGFRQVHFTR